MREEAESDEDQPPCEKDEQVEQGDLTSSATEPRKVERAVHDRIYAQRHRPWLTNYGL